MIAWVLAKLGIGKLQLFAGLALAVALAGAVAFGWVQSARLEAAQVREKAAVAAAAKNLKTVHDLTRANEHADREAERARERAAALAITREEIRRSIDALQPTPSDCRSSPDEQQLYDRMLRPPPRANRNDPPARPAR